MAIKKRTVTVAIRAGKDTCNGCIFLLLKGLPLASCRLYRKSLKECSKGHAKRCIECIEREI